MNGPTEYRPLLSRCVISYYVIDGFLLRAVSFPSLRQLGLSTCEFVESLLFSSLSWLMMALKVDSVPDNC